MRNSIFKISANGNTLYGFKNESERELFLKLIKKAKY